METRKKKSFKRLFAFLMAFVMVASLAVSAVFAAEPTFKDVPKTHDFYDEIEDLAARKIVKGYGTSGNFGPEDNLTRAQAAKMVALAADIIVTPGFKTEFKDVDSTVDMYKQIWALEEAEVVQGYGKTNLFKPDFEIERGHVAKMIVKALDLDEGAFAFDFPDLPNNDEEVAEAIEILASNDIVHGYGSTGLFKPAELVTRGQFSKMLSRALAVVESKLKVQGVESTGNEFRETAAAGDMIVTIKATYAGNALSSLLEEKDGKKLIKKITVKLDNQTLIDTLDYKVAGLTIEIKQAVLNALAEGTHNVDITLDDVELPTQKITVKKLKQAGLEATITPVKVAIGAATDDGAKITLTEYDALGVVVSSINLNGVIVKANGVALKAADFDVANPILIKKAYINELKAGEYEFEVILVNGLSAKVDFEVFDKTALKLDDFDPATRKVSDAFDLAATVKKIKEDGTVGDAPAALKSVKVNGVALSSTRYEYVASSGTLTVKAAYLDTLALGEYSVVVEADDLTSKASKFKIVEGDLAKATFDIAKKTEVKAYDVLPVVVEVKDVKGNILKETKVAITAARSESKLSLKATEGFFGKTIEITTDKSGKATLYYKSEVAGEDYLYAGVTDSADVRSEKFTVVPVITLEGTNVAGDYHTNTKYGNVVALSADYKVTGMLKYHKTDPTGMGFGAKDHYFLVFTIKGMPNPVKVVLEGLYDGEATITEFDLTKNVENWVFGVEKGEDIKITFKDGTTVLKVITLDLSGLALEE